MGKDCLFVFARGKVLEIAYYHETVNPRGPYRSQNIIDLLVHNQGPGDLNSFCLVYPGQLLETSRDETETLNVLPAGNRIFNLTAELPTKERSPHYNVPGVTHMEIGRDEHERVLVKVTEVGGQRRILEHSGLCVHATVEPHKELTAESVAVLNHLHYTVLQCKFDVTAIPVGQSAWLRLVLDPIRGAASDDLQASKKSALRQWGREYWAWLRRESFLCEIYGPHNVRRGLMKGLSALQDEMGRNRIRIKDLPNASLAVGAVQLTRDRLHEWLNDKTMTRLRDWRVLVVPERFRTFSAEEPPIQEGSIFPPITNPQWLPIQSKRYRVWQWNSGSLHYPFNDYFTAVQQLLRCLAAARENADHPETAGEATTQYLTIREIVTGCSIPEDIANPLLRHLAKPVTLRTKEKCPAPVLINRTGDGYAFNPEFRFEVIPLLRVPPESISSLMEPDFRCGLLLRPPERWFIRYLPWVAWTALLVSVLGLIITLVLR